MKRNPGQQCNMLNLSRLMSHSCHVKFRTLMLFSTINSSGLWCHRSAGICTHKHPTHNTHIQKTETAVKKAKLSIYYRLCLFGFGKRTLCYAQFLGWHNNISVDLRKKNKQTNKTSAFRNIFGITVRQWIIWVRLQEILSGPKIWKSKMF